MRLHLMLVFVVFVTACSCVWNKSEVFNPIYRDAEAIRASGSNGLMNRYDFSSFAERPIRKSHDYDERAISVLWVEDDSKGLYMSVESYSYGRTVVLFCTPDWYAEQNNMNITELKALLLSLWEDHGGDKSEYHPTERDTEKWPGFQNAIRYQFNYNGLSVEFCLSNRQILDDTILTNHIILRGNKSI